MAYLARIVKVHVGRDGKVRVVMLRNVKGVYKRPIVKIVPLIQSNKELIWKQCALAGGMLVYFWLIPEMLSWFNYNHPAMKNIKIDNNI